MTGEEFEDVEVLAKTEEALKVEIPDLGETIWIPFLVIMDESEITKDSSVGTIDTLVVKPWWAKKAGLV